MRQLVPQFILQNLANGQGNGRFPAVCLFVDTSGFTSFTTSVMAHESAGVEQIADVLATVFKPLVHIVYQHGGYLSGFAGDSFKAIFPLGKTAVSQTTYRRAVRAAWQIRTHMANHAQAQTPFGSFDFAVKVTVADGDVEWGIWQAETTDSTLKGQQQAYYFEGEALSRCLAADAVAQAGDVLLTDAVYTAVSQHPLVTESTHGYWRIQSYRLNRRFLPRQDNTLPQKLQPLVQLFYPDDMMPDTRGEFRQVVSLFINLQTLPQTEGEREFIATFFRLLHRHGGYLCRVGRIGDKDSGCTLLLFWGAPISHENDTLHALNFAWELLQLSPILLKAGLTTNLAYAGYVGSQQREEYTCHGAYVNLAARQMVLGEWGTILLDEASAKLAQDQFSVRFHGTYPLKGFADEQSVFVVNARRTKTAVPFYHGKLIGRQMELGMLETAVAPIFSHKFAGIITVVGEAGIGKSRLIHTFLQTLKTVMTPSPLILLCQTDEILRQSLNPFRYMLRQFFLQQTDVSEEENQTRFIIKITRLRAETADLTLQNNLTRAQPFLQALINLPVVDPIYDAVDPKLRFENSLTACKTLLLALAVQQSVILHIEDAHWLDDDSITFLQQLTRNVNTIPLAILVSTRRPLPQALIESSVPQVPIQMQPLPSTTLHAFAQDVLQHRVDDKLLDLLETRTDGNPFFMEQLLLYWREQGVLRPSPAGLTLSQVAQAIPVDVRTILIARLDQLVADVKEVVQTAAVLGRAFELPVLSHMLHEDRRLPEKIDAAQNAAIWTAMNEFSYLFKHALLRDAAYEMQLKSRRRQVHMLAAESILQLHATDLASNYADIAYHYDQAGGNGEAALWYKLAGERAARLFANVEAEKYFSRALTLTPESDWLAQYKLLLGRETIFKRQGRREDQLADLNKLAELVTSLANGTPQGIKRQVEIELRCANYAELVSDFETAVMHTETAVQLAESVQDNIRLANAYLQWGKILWPQSQFESAIEKLNKAYQLGKQSKMPHVEASALGYLGVVADLQGNYDDAKQFQQQSLALFKQLNDQEGITSNLNNIGIIHLKQGKYAEARTYLEQALENHRAIGYRAGESWALANLGFVAALLGQYDDANHYYLQALAIFREVGDVWSQGMAFGHLGLSAANQGEFSRAMQYQKEALVVFKQVGYRQGEGMAIAAMGSLFMRLGNYEQAIVHLEDALAINCELKVQRGQAQALVAMSLVYHLMADDDAANQCATDAHALAEEMGERQIQAGALTNLGLIYTSAGKFEEAEAHFEQALALRRNLGEMHLALEALAGLVNLHQVRGNLDVARSFADEIIAYLAQNRLDGVDEPGRIYLNVINSLLISNDRQVGQIIKDAYRFLQERVSKIESAAEKHSFLQYVAANREIVQLYKKFSLNSGKA
ncbi:MAG: tetratricopeptide repeat protein [Chloroflexi bacterium]|nr:tetratricopeptide repeat protein [Chloroflexota bacterium]